MLTGEKTPMMNTRDHVQLGEKCRPDHFNIFLAIAIEINYVQYCARKLILYLQGTENCYF